MDGLARLPVGSSKRYHLARRIVRLLDLDRLRGRCVSARGAYVRFLVLDRGRGQSVPARIGAGVDYVRPSLWIVGDVWLPRSVMSAITIAGAASNVPHTTRRSRRLLLSCDSLPLVLWYIRYPPVGEASYLFVTDQVLTVCFATSSTDYRVGTTVASARWPFLEKSALTSSTRGRFRPRPGRAPSRGYPPPP
jgi:hypothetical protein